MDFITNIPNWDSVYESMLGLGTVITLCRKIDGQVAIVTGANVGIGYETAKDLAKRGGKVIMACQNVEKGKQASTRRNKERDICVCATKSVREFSKRILAEQTRLDILVNNAGAATIEKVLTEDKLETNMAANHFGPFLLTNLLSGVMRKTEKARIVMVSSSAHKFPRKLDFDNLNAEKYFQGDAVYTRTKLANVLFTRELDRRFPQVGIRGITVYALHPGAVETSFLRYMDEIWYRAIIHRIVQLFMKETSISVTARNVKLAKDLWEKSAQAVSLKPEETIF